MPNLNELLLSAAGILLAALATAITQRRNIPPPTLRMANPALTASNGSGNGNVIAARVTANSIEFIQEQVVLLQHSVAALDARLDANEQRLGNVEQVARSAPREYETYTNNVSKAMLDLMREEFGALRKELKP